MRTMQTSKIGHFVLVIGIFCLYLGAAGTAWTEGNIGSGAWEIHPYAGVEQRYDNNIYLDPDNEKDDQISVVTGGVNLKTTVKEHQFEFDYRADLVEYWDYSTESTDDHRVFALMELNSPSGFSVEIEDTFKKTADPPDLEKVRREERIRNIGSVTAEYQMTDLGISVGYTNILDDYDELESLDKTENIVTLSPNYQVLPKVSAFCEYNYGWIDYDQTVLSNAEYHQARLGVKGELTPKLTGMVKCGYQWRDYDQAAKKDFDGGVIFASLTEEFSERTQLEIFGDLGVNESSYSPNNYYRLSRLGLELKQELGYKWSLNLEGSYQRNKYPEQTSAANQSAKRKDDVLIGGIGVDYQIQDWLVAGVNYNYRERSSNLDAFDYGNNLISVNLLATF